MKKLELAQMLFFYDMTVGLKYDCLFGSFRLSEFNDLFDYYYAMEEQKSFGKWLSDNELEKKWKEFCENLDVDLKIDIEF